MRHIQISFWPDQVLNPLRCLSNVLDEGSLNPDDSASCCNMNYIIYELYSPTLSLCLEPEVGSDIICKGQHLKVLKEKL